MVKRFTNDKPPQRRIRNWCQKVGYRLFKVPMQDEWYIVDPKKPELIAGGRMAELEGRFLKKRDKL